MYILTNLQMTIMTRRWLGHPKQPQLTMSDCNDLLDALVPLSPSSIVMKISIGMVWDNLVLTSRNDFAETSTIDDEWMWNDVTLLWSEPHGYNSLPSSPSCIATFGSPLVGPLRRFLLLRSNDKEWSRAIVYLEVIDNCAQLLLIASWVYRFLVGWSWQHDQLDTSMLTVRNAHINTSTRHEDSCYKSFLIMLNPFLTFNINTSTRSSLLTGTMESMPLDSKLPSAAILKKR